jgi:hypothetical protein
MNRLKKILVYTMLFGLFLGVFTTGVSADGTETLGIPSINIATGSGIVAKGTGLITQPGTININVPTGASIKQVLLYWEGQHTTANGDNTIEVNSNLVTGKLIGGPTLFFSNVKSSSYRADITSLNIVKIGSNAVQVKGLSFNNKNHGAGIIVIFEKGDKSDIQIKDGNDLAYFDFDPPLDTTVKQTFTFEPATINRKADLSMFFSSIFQEGQGFRPTVIEVKVDGVLTEIIDALNSNDGQEWDTLTVQIDIPAGAKSLSVQALSENRGKTDGKPASLAWTTAALSLQKEIKITKGRMTGGGSVFKGDTRVTHGFEIRCNLKKPNNLEVNWPEGNNFHMTELTSAICTDDPAINPKPPKAPFDTFTGKGTGKLNGVSGAKIEFVFTDAGEPGTKDKATMKIWDNKNNLVLEVSGLLNKGNHQAHKS